MAWSLMNHMIADRVTALLDEQKYQYPPEVKRFYSREQAASIIHAALWGHGVREDSTAGAYAAMNLFDAIGIKFWCFDQDEADQHQALRQKLQRDATMTAQQDDRTPISRDTPASPREEGE